jgi:hypothetical protein
MPSIGGSSVAYACAPQVRGGGGRDGRHELRDAPLHRGLEARGTQAGLREVHRQDARQPAHQQCEAPLCPPHAKVAPQAEQAVTSPPPASARSAAGAGAGA